MMMRYTIFFLVLIGLSACKNRDVNEGEEFRPRPIKDNFDDSFFTKLTVDGVEYIMMERDNNNPHEGFGFMAFRANKMLEKQDTLFAYLQAIQLFQNRIYARMFNLSDEEAQNQFNETIFNYLKKEQAELDALEQESFINNSDSDQESKSRDNYN